MISGGIEFNQFAESHSRLEVKFGDNLSNITQLTFACLKSTIKTLEKGVKYVQS